MIASGEGAHGGWGSAIGRGAGLFAGLGGVLAGFAATPDWPIVGITFGAIEGAFAGAVFGIVDAMVLVSLARATRSLWGARATSGAAAGAAALSAAAVYTGPIDSPTPLTAALIATAALVGALFGPPIAVGMECTPGGRTSGDRTLIDLHRQVRRFLAWGAAVGASAGAVTGMVIGIRTYLPTAAFAAAEGAVFGVVSGLMLACLAAAAWLLPRVRTRR